MNCFMFPGQPLTRGGALPADGDFHEIAEHARRAARFDLESFEWLGGEGSEQVKLQVYGVAESLYGVRRLRRLGIAPQLVLQHSMGIYAALAACRSVSEEAAIEITVRVGQALARLGEKEEYALGCVIGLTAEKVLALAANNNVHLANHNTSRHFLLCGRKPDLEQALVEALAAGAFSTRSFECDGPLHTPLMAPLEQELSEIFGDYHYGEPACRLMDHLEQRYLSADGMASFMLRELCLPVYWDRTYRAARSAGATTFYEVGAGDSLKKYNRWIEADIEA